jgi:hypothetical protein
MFAARALLALALAGTSVHATASLDVAVKAPWPTGPSSFLLEAR